MQMRVQAIVRECVGRTLLDASGDQIGTIKAVYADDQTAQPEWFAVGTRWFGDDVSFVPIHGTDMSGEDVRSLYSKEKVKHSPRVHAEGHLSAEDQRDLYEYYRVTDLAPIGEPEPPTSANLNAPDLLDSPPTRSEVLRNDPGDIPLTGEP